MAEPKDRFAAAETLSNGLTPAQQEELDDVLIEIERLVHRLGSITRHRSLSLAVTKLEEAAHWIRDRIRTGP